MTTDELVLRAGDAAAVFAADGGRLTSLQVGGLELLVGPDADPMRWGSYAMVPWAGRIRYGRFAFDGVGHELPIVVPPHAIHGTAYLRPWTIDGESMRIELGEQWPFAATATQEVELHDDRLILRLRLQAHERQPAMVGWHPWFRRTLGAPDGGVGGEAELRVEPVRMFELDDDLIPTGTAVDPGPQPWDNCFELAADPVIRWPDHLELSLGTDCRYWTIYTHPPHALCVEPQTDVPDAVNRTPAVVEAGEELSARFELAWR